MKATSHTISAASLALALGSALTLSAAPFAVQAADNESATASPSRARTTAPSDRTPPAPAPCTGTAKIDYQGNSWKYVPAGTCEKTASPTSPTGFGQLEPFKEKKEKA